MSECPCCEAVPKRHSRAAPAPVSEYDCWYCKDALTEKDQQLTAAKVEIERLKAEVHDCVEAELAKDQNNRELMKQMTVQRKHIERLSGALREACEWAAMEPRLPGWWPAAQEALAAMLEEK
jgi:hypothetical protein